MSFNIAGSLFALQQLENAKHNNCIIPNDTQFYLDGNIVTLAELFAYYKEGHKKIEKITETAKQQSAVEEKVESKQRMEGTETKNKKRAKVGPNNGKSIDKKLQSSSSESE